MTAESLRSQTRKQLELLARRDRIPGCHDMTKDELIAALVARFRSSAPPTTKLRRQLRGKSDSGNLARRSSRRRVAAVATSRRPSDDSTTQPKGAALPNGAGGSVPTPQGSHRASANGSSRAVVLMDTATVDAITAVATDPHWLSVQWTISQAMTNRAQVALGRGWRTAVPVLRLYDATSEDDRGSARAWVRDETLRGDDPQWYLRVESPGRTWIVEIGFRAADGSYFRIAHSAPVSTPANNGLRFTESRGSVSNGRHGHSRGVSHSVAALVPKAVLASRLRTSAGRDNALSPSTSTVQLRTELMVTGVAHPDASVTLMNQPIPLAADGSFSLRLPLDGGREVIPADVVSPDGSEQRTIILTIDQNVRHLEPQVFDENAE